MKKKILISCNKKSFITIRFVFLNLNAHAKSQLKQDLFLTKINEH